MSCIPSGELLQALSAAFAYPADGIDATLSQLKKVTVDGGLAAEAGRVIELASGFESRTDEQLAYTRLFIGSFRMEAPPYASYYLEPGHLLNGATASRVRAVFRQFGIELAPECKEPADHIRYLLAFLSVLARRYRETGERAFADAYADFLQLFVLSWYREFQGLVDAHAENPYYPHLVRLIGLALEEGVRQ